MDPHPLANLFKRSNYDEPTASELSALDYLYEVLLEIRESENCDEVLKEEIEEVIHDVSLNEKHDCNDIVINSISVNCANNMKTPKLGYANFDIFTTYCNDHDWGDNVSYDLENLFMPHDEYAIGNNVCNNIESGFRRVLTLGKNNPTYLENAQSYDFFDKCGFGEVMTLVDVNPTILKDYKTFMHVDHEENISHDIYIVEFEYDSTCNYYERGKYGYRNLHVTKLPLFMLRLLLFLSSSMLMLEISCLDNLLLIKCLCIGSMSDLNMFVRCFMILSLCFNSCPNFLEFFELQKYSKFSDCYRLFCF
jgi:hypothetical protein